eukprot:m.15130 g.15130  ORF g.15130 m.15130 type:complete len:278 (-) comp10421_c0_seq1:24-857(-)
MTGWTDVLIRGAIEAKGTSGGPACFEHTSSATIVTESVVYTSLWTIAWLTFKPTVPSSTQSRPTLHSNQGIDYIIAALHVITFIVTLACKVNTQKGLYILSPCHVILMGQAMLLLLPPSAATRRSCFLMAILMLGSFMALVLPDTATFKQPFEVEAFWVEHVLIVFVAPLRIYQRHLQEPWAWSEMVQGLFLCQLLHMPGWMAIAYFTQVNIEFMLCPSNGLAALLATQSSLLAWVESHHLSYRTVMIIGYCIPGILFGALHLSIGRRVTRARQKTE